MSTTPTPRTEYETTSIDIERETAELEWAAPSLCRLHMSVLEA